jgi:hypothetical protein
MYPNLFKQFHLSKLCSDIPKPIDSSLIEGICILFLVTTKLQLTKKLIIIIVI